MNDIKVIETARLMCTLKKFDLFCESNIVEWLEAAMISYMMSVQLTGYVWQ